MTVDLSREQCDAWSLLTDSGTEDMPDAGELVAPSDEPEVVYHYTDANGLLGILKDGGIRCTHIRYLNDTQEYRQAAVEFLSMLSEFAAAPSADTGERMAAQAKLALDVLQAQLERNPYSGLEVPCHVASFSRLNDNLAQWRAYSGGGPRFAIGFRTDVLRKMAEDLAKERASLDFKFKRVHYSGADARGACRKSFVDAVQAMEKEYFKTKPHCPPENMHRAEIGRVATAVFRDFAPLIKNESFAQEQEIRLCHGIAGTDQTDYRTGRSTLVPYVLWKWPKDSRPIASITVGPTPHPAEAEMATRNLVMKHRECIHSFDSPTTLMSAIPYRDWT